MRRMLLMLMVLFTSVLYSQIINDSTKIIIGGEKIPLIYKDYDFKTCYSKGEYVKGVNDDTLYFPIGIFKCSKYSSENYIIKAYYNGEVVFFELKEDKPIVLLGEKGFAKDFFELYESLSGQDKIKLNLLNQKNSEDYMVYLKDKLFKEINSYKKYGIAIVEAYPTEDYSMTGAHFEILNASTKTIKYITFNFYGKNAVKDKVGQNKSRKGIGPIEPFSTAKYEFDSVWLTDVVQTLKLMSVNIIFMDGTSKTVIITSNHWIDSDILYQVSNL